MEAVGARTVSAARAMVGTPFRHRGRGPGGIDCVGLVLRSLALAGKRLEEPAPYLPTAGSEEVVRGLRAALEPLPPGAERAGDVALVFARDGARHLAIFTGSGFVHVGRRVVEEPARQVRTAGFWRPR